VAPILFRLKKGAQGQETQKVGANYVQSEYVSMEQSITFRRKAVTHHQDQPLECIAPWGDNGIPSAQILRPGSHKVGESGSLSGPAPIGVYKRRTEWSRPGGHRKTNEKSRNVIQDSATYIFATSTHPQGSAAAGHVKLEIGSNREIGKPKLETGDWRLGGQEKVKNGEQSH
jgi:hypothetical protein